MSKREIRVMIKSTKTNQRRIALMDDFMRIILGLTDKKIIPDYKRQSKNIQKREFKNVQCYSFNTSFKR